MTAGVSVNKINKSSRENNLQLVIFCEKHVPVSLGPDELFRKIYSLDRIFSFTHCSIFKNYEKKKPFTGSPKYLDRNNLTYMNKSTYIPPI